jgi:plastocyanin
VVPTSTPTPTPTTTPVAAIGSRNSRTVITGRGEIAFQTPKVVPIAKKTVEGTRAWSPKTTEMYVGDTAQWSWDANENIVESSSSFTPMAQPRFASGVLALKSSFAHTAKQPGTYYFASENTAAMTGVLIAKPRVTITNGNLDVPGNFTHHGMPFGGTIFAVTSTGVGDTGWQWYAQLGNSNTRAEYLRGKNGGNCAQGAELLDGGGVMTRPYLPTESQLKDKRYKASYDSWLKLTTASGVDPKHGLCPPPKVIVRTTRVSYAYHGQTTNNFLYA